MNFYNKTIDIISPSMSCTLDENQNIKNLLEEKGYKTNIYDEEKLALEVLPKNEFSPFSAQTRFEQFSKAVQNPDSQLIWCTKGGYGCAEIIPLVEKMPKPQNKKILIGFSDITSLNKILIEDWGWEVIIAPMLNQLASNRVSEKSKAAIFDLISGKTKKLEYDLHQNGEISGEITGGCLSVLCSDFATNNQINWQDKILFLEDEGEDGERVDRFLQQILRIIIEQNQKPQAILFGNFLQSNPHGSPKAKNIEIALDKFTQKIKEHDLDIKIFKEISNSLGHSQKIKPIILGRNISIEKNQLIQTII